MDIQKRKGLRKEAAAAVASNPGDVRYTLLIYLAVMAFSGLFVPLATMILDQQIANTGGLKHLSTQSTLSTIRTMIPVILIMALLGLNLGRQAMALALARRQTVEPRTLLLGYPRFGAMLRILFVGYLVFRLVYNIAAFPATFIYLLSPLSGDFMEQLIPIILENPTMEALLNNEEYMELWTDVFKNVIPLCLALSGLVMVAIAYPFRMAPYCLLDDRYSGALASLMASKRMTKGHRSALFLLDLSFWWFYLGLALCICVMNGQPIAASLGIALPWEANIANLIFIAIGIALAALLLYCSLNKVQTTYAAYYDAIRPQPQPNQGGVVLGNIFDLAREHKEK